MLVHSAAYFAVRAVNGFLALAALAILTRLLEPTQYGTYALAMAAVTVAATVLFQWLNIAVARFYAAHAASAELFLTEVHRLFARIAIAGAAGAAVWALLQPVSAFTSITVLIIAGSALGLGLHNLHLQIVNARGQPVRYGLISATRAAIALVLAVVLVDAGFGAAGALTAFGVGCLVAVGCFGVRWTSSVSPESAVVRGKLLSYGPPMALAAASMMVLDVSDRFFLGWWHGPAVVAGYAAAYDLAQQTVGIALSVFLMASYPRITAAWESGGTAAARAAMAPLARALVLFAPLVIGLFVGLAPEIARLMFGAGVRSDAALVMPWVACAIGIGCLKAYMLDVALHLSKSSRLLVIIATAMAILNVALNLVLIPRFGVLGAAAAAAAAFLLGAALSWWHGRRVGVYPPLLGDLVKGMAALVAMVSVLKITVSAGAVAEWGTDSIGLAIRCAAGLAAFSAVAWLTDLSQLRTAIAAWRTRNRAAPP